jgi:hypothetical protein
MEWTALQLAVAANEEMLARNSTCLQLELTMLEAAALLGHLQLALRHPENRGDVKKLVRTIAQAIEAFLSKCGPATAEICRRGWDPEHDVGGA